MRALVPFLVAAAVSCAGGGGTPASDLGAGDASAVGDLLRIADLLGDASPGSCPAPTGSHYAVRGSGLYQIGDNGYDAFLGTLTQQGTPARPIGLANFGPGGLFTVGPEGVFSFVPVADANGHIEVTYVKGWLNNVQPSNGAVAPTVASAELETIVSGNPDTPSTIWCLGAMQGFRLGNPGDGVGRFLFLEALGGTCSPAMDGAFDVQMVMRDVQSAGLGRQAFFRVSKPAGHLAKVSVTQGPVYERSSPLLISAMSSVGTALGAGLMVIDSQGGITKARDFHVCPTTIPNQQPGLTPGGGQALGW